MKHKEDAHKVRMPISYVGKGVKKGHSLSEQNVIILQNFFLTSGVHCIHVPDIQTGRTLLETALASFKSDRSISLLTTVKKKAVFPYSDLYKELGAARASSHTNGALEEYLLCSLNSDLLIIEATTELLQQPWYGKFEQLIVEYNIGATLPIIMIFHGEL